MFRCQSIRNKILFISGYLFICIFILCLSNKVFSSLGIYDYTEKQTTMRISMFEKSNERSYGRQMRIVSVMADGEKIDLSKFENDDWVWHEEWGYIFYSEGDSSFEIDFGKPVHSVTIEYVKQESSGNALVSLNDKGNVTLKMYRRTWKNDFLNIKFYTVWQKFFTLFEIWIVVALLYYSIWILCFRLIQPSQKTVGIKSSITMFDLAKGIGMITIIIGHSMELVKVGGINSSSGGSILIGLFYPIMSYGLMPMFFIASGYGFRVSDVKKTIKKQLSYLMRPYIIVSLAVFLVCMLRLLFSESFSTNDFRYMTVPFLLANAHECSIGSMAINSIGPMWFVVSLCFAWIFLNAILSMKKVLLQRVLITGAVFAGFLCSRLDIHFYCLTQIFTAMLFLYVGYWLKKKKIFSKETTKSMCIYISIIWLVILVGIINGGNINIATNNWGENYFLTIVTCICSGIIVIRGLLGANRLLDGKVQFLKELGRNTYLIFYIHTFEYLALPWNQIVDILPDNKVINCIIIILLRSVLIGFIFYVIKQCKGKKFIRNS